MAVAAVMSIFLRTHAGGRGANASNPTSNARFSCARARTVFEHARTQHAAGRRRVGTTCNLLLVLATCGELKQRHS